MARYCRYRPFQLAGYAVMIFGLVLSSIVSANSSIVERIIYQAIEAARAGLNISARFPAVQVPLTNVGNALATPI